MNRIYFLLLALFFLAFCNDQRKDIYILNENFNSNTIGWAEESTEAHKTELKEGHYYIYSMDTSREQSSPGPQNVSFFWDFPKKYEITSSFQSIEHPKRTRFGIMLTSPSLDYKFSFSDSSTAALKEWDYNRNSDLLVFAKTRNDKIDINTTPIEFKIKVDNSNFDFFINNELVGQGTFKTKSWDGIRLFTTTGSAVKIDYLRIKRLD
jgi:hypothetical protein